MINSSPRKTNVHAQYLIIVEFAVAKDMREILATGRLKKKLKSSIYTSIKHSRCYQFSDLAISK